MGYTLGRAPAALDPGADLTVAEQSAVAANLELAREAGARYLVQRWSDGTFCEKAGKNREVEVQVSIFHETRRSILIFLPVSLLDDYDRYNSVCQGSQDMFIRPRDSYTPFVRRTRV